MQSFDTNSPDSDQLAGPLKAIAAGRVEDLSHGNSKTLELPEGREIALYNVSGEFYATENFCPHKGAPLADGILCQHVIECGLHGWQFDVRTGDCLTVADKLKTYDVVIEGGLIKVLI